MLPKLLAVLRSLKTPRSWVKYCCACCNASTLLPTVRFHYVPVHNHDRVVFSTGRIVASYSRRATYRLSTYQPRNEGGHHPQEAVKKSRYVSSGLIETLSNAR